MKEFMFLIRNLGSHKMALPPNEHQQFLKKCEDYIFNLEQQGKLIAAQPLIRQGVIVSCAAGSWKEEQLNETEEMQVGYYHVYANDLAEAVEIAKGNPEFAYGSTARIEVRPIKTKETSTGFEYPKTV